MREKRSWETRSDQVGFEQMRRDDLDLFQLKEPIRIAITMGGTAFRPTHCDRGELGGIIILERLNYRHRVITMPDFITTNRPFSHLELIFMNPRNDGIP